MRQMDFSIENPSLDSWPFRDLCTQGIAVKEFVDWDTELRRIRLTQCREIIPYRFECSYPMPQGGYALGRTDKACFGLRPKGIFGVLHNDVQRLKVAALGVRDKSGKSRRKAAP